MLLVICIILSVTSATLLFLYLSSRTNIQQQYTEFALRSHEIRTRLNGVLGMTGLLLDTQLTLEQRDYSETILISGEALLEVVNDVLAFSKIELESFERNVSMGGAALSDHRSGRILNVDGRQPLNKLGVDEDALEIQPSNKTIRILLAEDNVVNQKVAVRILMKMGYQVDAANNGIELLEILETKAFDLILMDCQMPEMDGYRATQEIRKKEKGQNRHIPIIAMTAHALKGDRERCMRAGMDDYISKPIDIKVLAAVLKRCEESKSQPLTQRAKLSEMQGITSDSILIDMARIHDIFGNDTTEINEFLKNLIISTDGLLKEIELVIRINDKNAAKDLFHRLKGSSGNCGVMQIHALSVEAEEMVFEENWTEVARIFNQIIDVFIALEKDINEKLSSKLSP